MSQTTTIRVTKETHARVTKLAAERRETIDQTVASALRALRQDTLGIELHREISDEEVAWLDADAG